MGKVYNSRYGNYTGSYVGYKVLDLVTYVVRIMSNEQIKELKKLDSNGKYKIYEFEKCKEYNEFNVKLSYCADVNMVLYDSLCSDCSRTIVISPSVYIIDTLFGNIKNEPLVKLDNTASDNIALMNISGAIKTDEYTSMYIYGSLPKLEIPYGIHRINIDNNVRIGILTIPDTVKDIRGITETCKFKINTLRYKRPTGSNYYVNFEECEYIDNLEVDLSVLHVPELACLYANKYKIEYMCLPQLTVFKDTKIPNKSIKHLVIGDVLTEIRHEALLSWRKVETLEIRSKAFCVDEHGFFSKNKRLKRIILPKDIDRTTLSDIKYALDDAGKQVEIELVDMTK